MTPATQLKALIVARCAALEEKVRADVVAFEAEMECVTVEYITVTRNDQTGIKVKAKVNLV